MLEEPTDMGKNYMLPMPGVVGIKTSTNNLNYIT